MRIRKWPVVMHDAKDGSGDGVIELPSDLLAYMGLKIGDALKLKMRGGLAVLTPAVRKAKGARQKKRR